MASAVTEKVSKSTNEKVDDAKIVVATKDDIEEIMSRLDSMITLGMEHAGILKGHEKKLKHLHDVEGTVSKEAMAAGVKEATEDEAELIRGRIKDGAKKGAFWFKPRVPNKEGDGFVLATGAGMVVVGTRVPFIAPFIFRYLLP